MDVDDPSLKHCPTGGRLAAWRQGVLLCDLDELGRGAVDGHSAIQLAMLPGDEPGFGAGELHCTFDETIQYFLEGERRAANRFENPGGRGRSSMRLRQLSLQIS